MLLKRLYAKPLTLLGFGGKGHEDDASQKIYHGVTSEHVFIQQWTNDGKSLLLDRKTIVDAKKLKSLKDVRALKNTIDKGTTWLANQRKRAKDTIKKRPATSIGKAQSLTGSAKARGSHPMCQSKYKTCSKYSGGKAWAKPATSMALPFVLAAFHQKTSLCCHCQSRLVRENRHEK